MGILNKVASPGVDGTGASLGLLMLRLGATGMLIYGHGWPKVVAFSDKSDSFPDPLGVGSALSLAMTVFAEVLCAALVAIGAFTRLTVLPLVFLFGVAAFVIHADDPFKAKELAFVYLLVFTTLLFTGPGKLSVDGKIGK